MRPHRRSVLAVIILAACGSLLAQTNPSDLPRTAPDLIAALEQPRGRTDAMRALVAMGKAAVPHLEHVVEAANRGAASPTLPYVLRCLASIGPDAAHAQPLIRDYLKNGATDHLLAAMAAYADLAAYAPHREMAGPNRYFDDTSLLNHARQRLPRNVADPANQRAFLTARTQEIKVNQRVRVFQEHAHPDALETLTSIIERDLWFQREVAAEHLGRLGADASPALPTLAKALSRIHEPEAGVPDRIKGKTVILRDDFGERAAEAILRIDPRSPQAAEAHAFLVGHAADPRTRMDAVAGLTAQDINTEQVTQILSGWLQQSPNYPEPIHPEVFNAIGALGQRANSLVPHLEKIVAEATEPQARLATIALRQVRTP